MKCNPPVDQTQPVLPKAWEPDEPTTVVFKAVRCPEDLRLLREKHGLPEVVSEVHEELPGANWVEFQVEGASQGKGFRGTVGFELDGRDMDPSNIQWDGTADEWYDVYPDILAYVAATADYQAAVKAAGLE